MFKVVEKRKLNDVTFYTEIEAPLIAKKAKPGQFIIFKVDEKGERVPLTISSCNLEKGTVSIIYQAVGRSTILLSGIEKGGYVRDFVGPLGVPTHVEGYKKVCVVGGGVGCAIAYPQAKALFEAGAHVDVIAGFRSKEIVMLEEEMKACSTNLHITTDDGTYGEKGFVTDKLRSLIEAGNDYDLVIAIGPIIMMKFVAEVTRPFNVKTFVSLNPIMVDGTGMCGACRVTVGGETKFACVDGPDFDAHIVDFDELMRRNSIYGEKEIHDRDNCRLLEGIKNA